MRVVMLVHNDWKFDSRVTREAEALVRHGHSVDVVCRKYATDFVLESHNGIRYHCVPYTTGTQPLKDLQAHVSVMSLNVLWLLKGPRRAGALAAVAEHAASLLPVAIGSLLLFVGLLAWRLGIRHVVKKTALGASAARSGLILRLKCALSAVLRYLTQPFQYLNEYVHSCMATILSLRADAIHAHDLVTLSAAVLAAHRLDARLIYDSHELERHTNYHMHNLWTKHCIRRYETNFAARCDAIITVSDSIADWLGREYRIKRPVVVGNAPSTAAPLLSPVRSRDTVRKRIGVSVSTPVMVYVGSVTVDRGMEQCVRALRDLPGVHFAAVGPRNDATEAAMRETAVDVEAIHRLHFVDAVPPSDVMGFIADANCSVMAIQNICLSYYFCFPNKLLESVLAGLPVVVSDLLELRRFVARYNVGVVVDERRPSSIAQGINEVLARPDRYRPSSKTIAAIIEAHGWEEQQRRLVDLYRHLHRSSDKAGLEVGEPVPHSIQTR